MANVRASLSRESSPQTGSANKFWVLEGVDENLVDAVNRIISKVSKSQQDSAKIIGILDLGKGNGKQFRVPKGRRRLETIDGVLKRAVQVHSNLMDMLLRCGLWQHDLE
ncbi:hypothetical protein U1Q18_026315 [Sarracenia purpurea var. burkii]